MPASVRFIVSFAISVIAILLFVVLHGMEIMEAWNAQTSSSEPINDKIAYLATSIAGVVAAIVATALAVPVPQPVRTAARAAGAQLTAWEQKHVNTPRAFLARLGDVITGTTDEKKWKELLAAAYVLIYIVMGLAAAITWFVHDPSSLIKALALTFVGLMLAVVKSFFA